MRTKRPAIASALGLVLGISSVTYGAQIKSPEAQFRDAGFAALYNLDYSKAESEFQQFVESSPDNPAGYLYLAATIWIRTADQHRRLQPTLYKNDSFYSELEAEQDEAVDSEMEEAFEALIQDAMAASERKLKANRADVEALYFLGAAYAIKAGYEATVSRRFLAALRHGAKAAKLHKRVLKLDPHYVDANLMVGLYNYAVGSVSWRSKILLGLMGFRGHRQRGLQQIERVTREGNHLRDDAKIILLALYQREHQLENALLLVDQLSTAYPGNDLLALEKVHLLVHLSREPEALALMEQIIDAGDEGRALDQIYLNYGDVLLANGQNEAAALAFEQAAAVGDPYWGMLAHLRAGQALDLAQKRAEARIEYSVVLQHPEVFNSHKWARHYLKSPYSRR